jgi:hypothetical protein
MKRALIAAVVTVVLSATGADLGFAENLVAGRAFPLSNRIAPVLLRVEVHRVQSDGLIDVAVSFAEPRPAIDATQEELIELGELCVRYGAEILREAVPFAEQRRLRVFVPLYRNGKVEPSQGFEERGFAFHVSDGKCSLGDPYPAAARAEVMRRASLPVDD